MSWTNGGHEGNRADCRAASGLAPATTSSKSLVDIAELFEIVGGEGEAPRPPYRWDALRALVQVTKAGPGRPGRAEIVAALVCWHHAPLGLSMRAPG
jgi:hypothetical protein